MDNTVDLQPQKLSQLKRLFLEQLNYIENNVPVFTRINKEAILWLREKTKRVETLEALGTILMFPIPNRDMGMNLLRTNVTHIHPLENTCFPFGSGSFGSYTIKSQSHCGRFGFFLILSRLEVACPKVIQRCYGPNSATEGAIYHCNGFVFDTDSSFVSNCHNHDHQRCCPRRIHAVPNRFLFGNYFSSNTNTFELHASILEQNNLFSVDLECRRKGEFQLICQWDNGILLATLSQTSLPFYDGPHEGNSRVDNLGLLRWSMTNMNSSFTLHIPNQTENHNQTNTSLENDVNKSRSNNNKKRQGFQDQSCQGRAWMNHQWQRNHPSPKGMYRFWHNVFLRMGTPQRHKTHLRIYIQLHPNDTNPKEGYQYIIHVPVKQSDVVSNKTYLCSLYKFHSTQKPVYEPNCPFVIKICSISHSGNFSNLPTEIEIIHSGELDLPQSSRVRATIDDHVNGYVIRTPNHAHAFILPCSIYLDPNKDARQTRTLNLGSASIEMNNIRETKHYGHNKEYDKERIQSLYTHIETSNSFQSSFDKEVNMWCNEQDDAPLWYSVVFIIFLILSLLCAIMFILLPFVNDSKKTSKPKDEKEIRCVLLPLPSRNDKKPKIIRK